MYEPALDQDPELEKRARRIASEVTSRVTNGGSADSNAEGASASSSTGEGQDTPKAADGKGRRGCSAAKP